MNFDLFEPFDRVSPKSYADALRGWLASAARTGRLQHESSSEMYEYMWKAWTVWAVGEGIELMSVTEDDLAAYIQSRGGASELSARYAWRFLRLLEWVLEHHARHLDIAPNVAPANYLNRRPDIRFANASESDSLPEYLSAREAKDLVIYLSAHRFGRRNATPSWQEVRNRASVGLMLGAGLTPGEIRALQTEDAITGVGKRQGVPWKLHVAGNGNAPSRETPIAQWSAQLLAFWLSVRQEQQIPGTMMFPSTRSTGKAWGKVAQYIAAKEVMRAAGIDAGEGGSFKLRHTFALRQLRRGRSPADVSRWLGVADPSVMARYMRVVSVPVDLI